MSGRRAHRNAGMAEQAQVDADSTVSDLTSLEGDADDFEKLMIQNARDERRLNEALSGRVQAFRKAGAHPRVGQKIDNLERNNARNEAAQGANGRVSFGSPPGGSAVSDPAIHAPAGWGRKDRAGRNWTRPFASEEQQQQQHTPVQADDRHYDDDENANVPRHSIEDSPLSHKSAYGTPHRDGDADWDFTFDLNEASILASTPYIPRNTVLDDIRQQEIESLKEQAVTKARLGSIREGSPEEMRRPRSPSAQSGNSMANSMANSIASLSDQAMRAAGSPQRRLRTKTNSWQSLGKAQPTTAIGREDSPIAVYKGSETIGVVERELVVSAQKSLPRRLGARREDSQDLLRRLARVSNTPSPGRIEASRPQTAHGRRPGSSSQSIVDDVKILPQDVKGELVDGAPITELGAFERPASVPEVQPEHDELPQDSPEPQVAPESLRETPAEDVDATPMPAEQSMLNPKTPVVTGAWVDTPGPKTALRATNIPPPRSRSQSPRKASLRQNNSPKKRTISLPASTSLEPTRPNLPTSALQALIQSARRESADYGDSTINSLEDLISPSEELDEDTLQGLKLPTATPRNDAERQRQDELLHLHRMNDKLRAARTSIRDASRGMKRLDDQVEHEEEGERGRRDDTKRKQVGSYVSTSVDCPCAVDGGHVSVLQTCKKLFWDERIKASRKETAWRNIGGLTGLGIFLTALAVWWVSEEVACEFYCHPQYAASSPYPFSVNMDAPQYPFVLPTLFYRSFVRAWWLPLYTLLSGFLSAFGDNIVSSSSFLAQSQGIRLGYVGQDQTNMHTFTRSWAMESQAPVVDMDEMVWEASMMDDEVLKERKVRM